MLKGNKNKLSKDYQIDEIPYFLEMLEEPIVDYDCSVLCRDSKDDMAYCCQPGNALPLLYKTEYQYLRTLSDFWGEWKPTTKEGRQMLEYAGENQIFAECSDPRNCKRKERSITCRVFPLEPYIDRRGVFVCLTFMQSFLEYDEDLGRGKCPLAMHTKDIRQEFIDSHFLFWQSLLLRFPREYQIYKSSSASLRKYNKKNKSDIILFYPSSYKNIKSMRDYI